MDWLVDNMELKVDSRHKKIDLKKINLSSKKRIPVRVGSLMLSLMLLSGCGVTPKKDESVLLLEEESYSESYDVGDEVSDIEESIEVQDTVEVEDTHSMSDTITIPNYLYVYEFDDGRQVEGNTYTYDDLAHIQYCFIIVRDGEDYSYLKYMTGLKKINITDLSEDNALSQVDSSIFPPGISIQIDTPYGVGVFNEERYGFLKDISSIDTLTIGNEYSSLNVDSSYLQSLRNVSHLRLGLDFDTNFQYQDLTYLKSLEFLSDSYDTALYFTNDMLDELENAGVSIITYNMNELREINQKIHDIYLSLNIPDGASDQEKLNAILTYVVSNLTYDPEVSAMLEETGSVDRATNDVFYRDGYLTAAFEDPTQICGNYAALTYVLCKEAGLSAYNMSSMNHAWNAVQVGDYYYYVDSTWLDGVTMHTAVPHQITTENGYTITFEMVDLTAEDVLKSNDQEKIDELPWYMEDPTNYQEYENEKESHQAISIPAGLELVAIPSENDNTQEEEVSPPEESSSPSPVEEESKVPDITDKKFKLTIAGKTVIIGGAALAGILSALGIGVLVHKKKEKKRRERMLRQQQYYDSYFQDPFQDQSFSTKY